MEVLVVLAVLNHRFGSALGRGKEQVKRVNDFTVWNANKSWKRSYGNEEMLVQTREVLGAVGNGNVRVGWKSDTS